MTDLLDRLKQALADRYMIERELGRGGMATVYLAQDLKHRRKVAIKVLDPELARALGSERFLREVQVTANLNHPHILPLHDSGEVDGVLYYVMPYVEGETLRERITREGQLPLDDALQITKEVAAALSYAHSHDVIHRDIKPENILLSAGEAVVADFGIARAITEAGGEHLTETGISIGTPTYMSPEQASGAQKLDGRSDVYSLGCVLYEMLAGEPPFTGPTAQAILARHALDPVPALRTVRSTVPDCVDAAVGRALAKVRADRPGTGTEFAEALATPSGGFTPAGTMPVAALRGRRGWLAAAAAAVVVVVIVVALPRMLAPNPITITTSNSRAVTSEPGLEWHPALSPDGDEVAFVARRAGGQTVVIRSTSHIAGGGELTPTQALGGSEWLVPAWSTDGEFIHSFDCPRGAIAFRDCSCTQIGKLGGSLRSIDLPGTPTACAWSPDGSRVAFTTWPDSILAYSISDGSTTLLAVSEVALVVHSPVWSPDGRRIAYVTGNQTWRWRFSVDPSAIWIVDADGGEPVRVTGDEYMDISPAWLDDGHLLFVSNRDGLREVYVVEVGPTGSRGEPRKVPGVTDPHSISYSIAGKQLAFSKATVRQNIWSYPIGSGPMSIRDGSPVTRENAIIVEHDISPDGKWIVYDSNLRGNSDIYKKRLDGRSPTPITDSPFAEFEPQWSPDGTEIAFSRSVADSWTVMVVPAEGGIPSEVANGIPNAWSPSGLDIAFVPAQSGQNEVWIVSRDSVGGIWNEATQSTDLACRPRDWAPDGSGVLVRCRGGSEIGLVSQDGEILWLYDLSSVGLWRIRDARYSWDGSTIYVSGPHEDGSSGIWALPPQGGEPNLVVAFDDAEISGMQWFSVGPDHLYVTVAEYESDILVMDVEVER